MKTPVIIAAYNEADHIGHTLQRLDSTTTEPMVVVNGEVGAKETIHEALTYTSNVYHRHDQGKLPALQYALRRLMGQKAEILSAPVLFLDADSYPLFPRQWHDNMTEAVSHTEEPQVAAGPIMYRESNLAIRAYRAYRTIQLANRAKSEHTLNATFGCNMAINFAGNKDVIDEIIGMEHIWPGEDRYIATRIAGEALRNFTQVTTLQGIVMTSPRFTTPFGYRLLHRDVDLQKVVADEYKNRRAPGVTHYYDNQRSLLIPYVLEG